MYKIKIRKNEMKFTILVISVMFLFTGCAVKSVDDVDKPASEERVDPKEPVEPIEPVQGVMPEMPSVKMAVMPNVPTRTDSQKENNTLCGWKKGG